MKSALSVALLALGASSLDVTAGMGAGRSFHRRKKKLCKSFPSRAERKAKRKQQRLSRRLNRV